MKRIRTFIYAGIIFALTGAIITSSPAEGIKGNARNSLIDYYQPMPDDTIRDNDTLPFPSQDDDGNPYKQDVIKSPLHLSTPAIIEREVDYNYKTGDITISQKIGDKQYRYPYSYSFEEYWKQDFNNSVKKYWRQRFKQEDLKHQNSLLKFLNPKIKFGGELTKDIFGSNTIDIKPTGSAELIFGINVSRVDNPALPENLRRNISFDFEEKIKMGVTGQIGDKIKLGINYDTKVTFDFENQVKLGYTGDEDEIIKSIEAGNVSLPLSGSLITGSQSLFGFKTALQFGKLTVTSVFSQQKGESSEITIEGGAQINQFELSASDYEANKHFFLAHYFEENYDRALRNLPIISSGVNITKLEVWVTNRTGNFESARNIVAFMDLAENDENIHADNIINQVAGYSDMPQNGINNLAEYISNDTTSVRDINQVTSQLQGLKGQGFMPGQDWEKVENARKLSSAEYTFHPQLGYISLNSPLNSDEVLAVAFEYTYQGKVYSVGELSTGTNSENTLIAKLLKGTSLTPSLPTWNLMMKNVYSIGAYQVEKEDFTFNIMYRNDKTGTAVNFIDEGPRPEEGGINGKVLLRVFQLDQLKTPQMEPGADGYFDFVPGVTINPSNGRIYFPVTEPFGDFLRRQIVKSNPNDPKLHSIADQFVFEELYTMIQSQAEQVAEKNKYFFEGNYKSSSGNEIMLNAMNIPEGSVKVTANGAPLEPNVDYIVDYNLGRVTILNEALLESGTPIKISLENRALFNFQTKTLIGSHFDYRFSDDFNIGATILHLNEKPMTNKVNFGDEPISNTIWGLNTSYSQEAPFLTRLVDNIPFIETKEKSSVSIDAEFAHFIPGHSRALKKGGVSYIDDFEGSKITMDIKTPFAWVLASTPQGQPDVFPEAELNSNLAYGFNRAKLAWYNINPDLFGNAAPSAVKGDQYNHYVREIYEQELFPNKETPHQYPQRLSVLNVVYYPNEKGPYNYDTYPTRFSQGINEDGFLNAPNTRWAGIMRQMPVKDFETQNIEFIEFWLMDPYIYSNPDNIKGGELCFNLGNISEDILKDSRKAFEHGLPTTDEVKLVDTTEWGRVPSTQTIVNSFDNNDASRQYQDVGLDGLGDEDEINFFSATGQHNYLDTIALMFGSGSQAYRKASIDPSNDNFKFWKEEEYDDPTSILERYKHFNGLEGNSPSNSETSGTNHPDVEDINSDYTLSETESYYQYCVNISPKDLVVGKNYITDKVTKPEDKNSSEVDWYQFKIPIFEPHQIIGPIQDFKSIRFMRMFLHDFDSTTVLRFAEFDLVRGEWRKYTFDLSEGNEGTMNPQLEEASFDISAVNIEENAAKTPVNYVLPPGVEREQDPTTSTQAYLINEQSLLLKVMDLDDGDARAAYKNVNLDVRKYKRLKMDVHAEMIEECDNQLEDNELRVFIRLGSDYKQNYYEYEIPLTLTEPGTYNNNYEEDRRLVWPDENRLDILFEIFQNVKQERNSIIRSGGPASLTARYSMLDGENAVTVMGNPNLSNIRTIMLGIRNPSRLNNPRQDDGLPKCVEVWLNELRLTDFNEEGGWAANARINARLADFATITAAGSTIKPGFGSIEKKVNERSKEEVYQYDISSTFELGKFFPKKANVKIPLYIGYSENFTMPEYNPLNPDILLKESLRSDELTRYEKDSLKEIAQDYTRRKSINLTNVKIMGPSDKQPHFYSISNWTASFAFSETYSRNINTEYDILKKHSGMLSYVYNARPKNVAPFKNIKFLRKPMFRIISDMNFYYAPKQVSFRTSMNKSFKAVKYRNISNPDILIEPQFTKDFLWDRVFDIKYDISRGIKFDFSSRNVARIDEPDGWVDKDKPYYEEKRDSILDNILSLGRTNDYNHQFNLSVNLPINKIRILNWISATGRYTGSYSWMKGPEPISVYRIDYTSLQRLREISDISDEYIIIVADNLDGQEYKSADDMRAELITLLGFDVVEEYYSDFLNATNTSINLGHTIKNSGKVQLNSQFNLQNLYNKVGYLQKINQKYGRSRGRTKQEKKTEEVIYQEADVKLEANKPKYIQHDLKTEEVKIEVKDMRGNRVRGEMKVISENQISFTSPGAYDNVTVKVTGEREVKESILLKMAEYTLNAITGVKSLSFNISQNNGTVLPGYMQETQFVGMKQYENIWAPGFEFIAGMQNEDFAKEARENGWLSKDPLLNTPFTMTNTTNLNFRGSLEPLPGLKIDLDASWTKSRNLREFYNYIPESDTSGADFSAKNRLIEGNFSMSFNPIRTAFWEMDMGTEHESKAFEQFLENRRIISERQAQEREKYPNGTPYYADQAVVDSTGFYEGYSPVAQQVMIPAFISAYSDMSPDNVFTGLFPKLPSLNWRVKYDGLSNIQFLKKYINRITIGHSYRSSYNIKSYITNPYEDRQDPSSDIFGRYENYDFIPEYEVAAVSIQENFSPLLNFDMQWVNSLSTKIEYNRRRTITLHLSNNKIIEMMNKEFIVGAGYRFKALEIIVNDRKFESDLNLRADFSIRDMVTIDRQIEQDNTEVTSGQRNFAVKTSADYALSERFRLRVFYEQTINDPKTSISYYTSNTKFGVSVRFALIP